jgi:ABC-type bacteriocin/lantibiotic exporter with double-glycine peptidase domain
MSRSSGLGARLRLSPQHLLPGPRRIPRTGDRSPAGSLWGYVRRMSGWHQVPLCMLAVAVAALSMVPLELQRRIVDGALADRQLDLLLTLAALYLVVVLLQTALKYGLRVYQGWLSESAIRQNREVLAEIHDCRVATGQVLPQRGRAVSIIGAEVEKLGGFVGEGLSQPVANFGMLLAIGGYMVVVEPWIALASLPFLAIQALAVPPLQRMVNRLLERRVRTLRRLGQAIATIGADGSDDRQRAAYRRDLRRVFDTRMRIYALKFAIKGLVNLLNHLAPLAVLTVGGYLVVQEQTSIGVVVAFISGFERLSNPVRELVKYYRLTAQARVQHQMIASWM